MKKILGWAFVIILIAWATNHQAHASHTITAIGNLLGAAAQGVGNLITKAGL